MILHTVLPLDWVLTPPPEDGASCCYRPLGRDQLEGLPAADGSFTVRRLISTNPRRYLDPALCPGSVYRTTPPSR